MRALIFFSEKKNVAHFIKYLEEELFLLGISTLPVPVNIPEKQVLDFNIDESEDFGIAIGGDGTVLYVSRLLYPNNILVFPVNFGNLGFITEIKKTEIVSMIKKYRDGQVSVEKRLMLESHIVREKEIIPTGVALNEVVISRHSYCKLIDVELAIDNQYVCRYRADGLIISSPTGSTAYSLSASGPIIEPDLNCFVITPICPHSLRVRPLVVSANKTIEVRMLSNEEQLIAIDGQEAHSLHSENIVVIKAAEKKFKIAKPDARSFYNVLKEKLNWLD